MPAIVIGYRSRNICHLPMYKLRIIRAGQISIGMGNLVTHLYVPSRSEPYQFRSVSTTVVVLLIHLLFFDLDQAQQSVFFISRCRRS